jgi:hypothetical protein
MLTLHTSLRAVFSALGTNMRIDTAIALAKGAATFVPGLYPLFRQRHMGCAESSQATYSYAVWAKHFSLMHDRTHCGIPTTVLDFGSGDTLGVSVAALLSGAERAIAVDTIPFARGGPNEVVAKGLFELFANHVPIEASGWPDFRFALSKTGFLPAVQPERNRTDAIVNALHAAINGKNSTLISYHAPFDEMTIGADSVDFLLSHSVDATQRPNFPSV